jgi:hypothetical protein
MKQVENIYDIPRIEEYHDEVFNFSCYSIGDEIRTYQYANGDLMIEVCIISNENEIMDKEKLSDLITQEGIKYFSLMMYVGGTLIVSDSNCQWTKDIEDNCDQELIDRANAYSQQSHADSVAYSAAYNGFIEGYRFAVK